MWFPKHILCYFWARYCGDSLVVCTHARENGEDHQMNGGGSFPVSHGNTDRACSSARDTLLYATACPVYVRRRRIVALTYDAVGRRWQDNIWDAYVVGRWWQARDQRSRRNMAAKMQPPFEPPSSASSERYAAVFSRPLIMSHIFFSSASVRRKSMNILLFSVRMVTCVWTTVRSSSPMSCARMPSITNTPTSAHRNPRGHRPQVDPFIVDSV